MTRSHFRASPFAIHPARYLTHGVFAALWLVGIAVLIGSRTAVAHAEEMPWIKVSPDAKGFVLESSGRPFVAWGFNYDHDSQGRLIEDYWDAEWPKVEGDLAEMRQLGANVVRVHLQLGKFMQDAETPNRGALDRLVKLVKAAEQQHLYLDLTGTTSSPNKIAGTSKRGSGKVWRAALQRAPRSSASI